MGIVLIRSIILYLAIILALRLMGKRQMGELQPTEFVITLLIAEVAAVPMQSNEIPMAYGLISIAVLVSLEVILSTVSLKFPALNELISGRPEHRGGKRENLSKGDGTPEVYRVGPL